LIELATLEDRDGLVTLHRASAPLSFFNDPSDPLHFATLIERGDDGRILGSISGRHAIEGFLEVSKEGSPRDRWARAMRLLEAGIALLRDAQVPEAHLHTNDPRVGHRLQRFPGCFVGAPFHGFFVLGGD
jgi:hypothetical protein